MINVVITCDTAEFAKKSEYTRVSIYVLLAIRDRKPKLRDNQEEEEDRRETRNSLSIYYLSLSLPHLLWLIN